jgi:hypothetical protein
MRRSLKGSRAYSIMATGTRARLAGHGRVIKSGTQETGSIVTYIARIDGGNMIYTFTYRNSPVVTVFAHIRGLSMIKRHNYRYPNVSGMTGITLLAGHWMCCGFISPGADTVVATRTIACLSGHCRVIKQNL